MTDQQIDLSRMFANARDVLVLRPGDILFREGEPGTAMYVVLSGTLRLNVGDRALADVGAGGVLGEMALIDGSPRSATAVAVEACELVPLDQQRFLFMVRETPFFSLALLRIVASRLRTLNRLL